MVWLMRNICTTIMTFQSHPMSKVTFHSQASNVTFNKEDFGIWGPFLEELVSRFRLHEINNHPYQIFTHAHVPCKLNLGGCSPYMFWCRPVGLNTTLYNDCTMYWNLFWSGINFRNLSSTVCELMFVSDLKHNVVDLILQQHPRSHNILNHPMHLPISVV